MSEQKEEVVEKIDKRELKGKVIASSRQVYRIVNSDVFYVESETQADLYYYVMFDTSEDGCEWCSCLDNSFRRVRCKHLMAVAYAIRWGTFTDTKKLPPLAKKDNTFKSYKEDEYSF